MVERMLAVEPTAVRGQQTHNGQPFPLVLQCQSAGAELADAVAWARDHAAELLTQSSQSGAILFRDFPLVSAEDFDAFIRAFGVPNFPYEQSLSNAVRVNRTERVFTANEAPADVMIYLHHEMAQTPVFPSRLFFFCEQPAEAGGETPLCRSDILLERLTEECPEFVRACAQYGLEYTNVMPSENDPQSGMGRSWQSTFRAETREQAEARMRELGYSWEWLEDGSLRATTPRLPAIREVAPGTRTFFNQLIAAFQGWKDSRNDPSQAIRHGNGAPLDGDAVLQAAAIAEELTFNVPWRRGDVALVDNFVVMHGRRTFEGTRRVLASLVAAESHLAIS